MEAILPILYVVLSQAAEAVEPVMQTAGAVKFTDMLMRYETLMVTGAAWTVIQVMQKSLPDLSDHPYLQRLKPLAPIALCVGMSFMPTFRLPGAQWDELILYGIVIGGTLSNGHKILGQTVLGKDRRINPYVQDPELRKIIDEYVAAKESGDAEKQRKVMDHLRHWLT
jgi:hypothetical protein